MKTPQGVVILGFLILTAVGVAAGLQRRTLQSEADGSPPRLRRETPRAALEADPQTSPIEAKAEVATLTPAPDAEAPAAVGDPAAEDTFWTDLGVLLEARLESDPGAHRDAVFTETLRYLGLRGAEAAAFRAAADQAVREIDQAWGVREECWLAAAAANPGQDDPVREQVERVIQNRYEDAKRDALGRLDAFLRDSPRDQTFRERVEEWTDAVR